MDKKNIKECTENELEKAVKALGEPAFRARQIFAWIYKKGAPNFAGMTNLPKKTVDAVSKDYYISEMGLKKRLISSDHTEKFLFELNDKRLIESVVIPGRERKTACLSTQVGCKFGCAFCASGSSGFVRDLKVSEILDQVLYLVYAGKHDITNYVFMGMGEPLDNFDNVSKAIRIMNDPDGLGIGARRITVSTCGIVPGIEKMKSFNLQINLSVSLHASNNALRDKLVPINKRYPIEKLVEACQDYFEATGRVITLEYILIDKVNDSNDDADKLADIARSMHAKVNVIPYSPVPAFSFFKAPAPESARAFAQLVERHRVTVTIRESKGKDIQAACGQLAGVFHLQ